MPTGRFQHTVIIPFNLEMAWIQYRNTQVKPESFNGFINRLIAQEMELLCVTAAPTSTIPSAM